MQSFDAPGPLAKYNDLLVRPKELPPVDGVVQYQVKTQNILLVIGPHNFTSVVDRDVQTEGDALMKKLSQNKSLMSGNNRGSTCVSMTALSNQIRTQLRMTGQDLSATFKALDTDGSGELDKAEFQYGLDRLGIDVTITDFNLVWSIFDRDTSGTIELAEFLEFMRADGNEEPVGKGKQMKKQRQADKHDIKMYNAAIMKECARKQRLQRVRNKTMIVELLRKVKQNMRDVWEGKTRAQQTQVATELFNSIDTDRGGTIDKTVKSCYVCPPVHRVNIC
jgi:Ca2+-binding EF-hand superfamily protein